MVALRIDAAFDLPKARQLRHLPVEHRVQPHLRIGGQVRRGDGLRHHHVGGTPDAPGPGALRISIDRSCQPGGQVIDIRCSASHLARRRGGFAGFYMRRVMLSGVDAQSCR